MNITHLLKKTACFIAIFIGLGLYSFAQSKKEQILQLRTKVDSLSQVVLNERFVAQQNTLKKQSGIDSLQRVLQVVQSSIRTTQNELNVCLENLNSETQCFVLKKLECEKNQLLKQSVIASLQKALNQCQESILLNQNELSAYKEFLTLERQRCAVMKLDCEKIQFQLDSSANAEEIKSFESEMVFVRGGTYQMGFNFRNINQKPVHSVTLSSFNIGKYEVTQRQWMAVMGSNPSNFSGCENCPVESVSWNDVQEYLNRLNARTGKNYRLPTEAEWEFAALGGEFSKG
jgi:formylglycine-generating enzyme required for sulfatase activity